MEGGSGVGGGQRVHRAGGSSVGLVGEGGEVSAPVAEPGGVVLAWATDEFGWIGAEEEEGGGWSGTGEVLVGGKCGCAWFSSSAWWVWGVKLDESVVPVGPLSDVSVEPWGGPFRIAGSADAALSVGEECDEGCVRWCACVVS